jgi:glycosyltransferase involved in cell wall biosynthesis
MKVLYFIPSLSQEGGGTRQYAVALLRSIAKDTQKNQYFILHNNEDPEVLSILKENVHLFHIPKRIGLEKKFEQNLTEFLRIVDFIYNKKLGKNLRIWSYVDRICKKYKIDIVHSPFQVNPFSIRAKKIFTLHDVQELHFPEYFSPEVRENRARNWLSAINRSDKIIVSYDHVKNDLIKYFRIPKSKVEVVLLEMNNLWFNKITFENSPVAKEKFEKYLLYPANTWPHKNHIRLIESINLLKLKYKATINLICTGHKNENFEFIKEKIISLGLEDQVEFYGIVDENRLYCLYKNAHGVVIPTTYEAGSFPLMESILLGIPVICSNVTSLPETIGSEEYLFDPFRVENIAEKIYELWTNENLRYSNIENSRAMSERLINTNGLEKLLRIYEDLNA